MPEVSAVRRKAWETRRRVYGPRGHNSSYSRPLGDAGLLDRALQLVARLHREEVLSEGQCCKALGMERVAFRAMCDQLEPPR